MFIEEAWKLQGKCANDPEIQEMQKQKIDPFYDKPEAKWAEWAKEYCSDCPVRLKCHAEGMQSLTGPVNEQHHGIWGGMSRRSRLRIHEKQKEQIRRISAQMKEQFQDTLSPNEDSTGDHTLPEALSS